MENEIVNEEGEDNLSAVWCLVGNIVDQRPYGPGGREQRRGTKHFRSGSKVYCFPPLWGDGYRKIKVIGHHRKSNKLITIVINSKWIVNRRADLVYSPSIIRRFEGRWDGSEESRQLAEALAGRVTTYQMNCNNYIFSILTIIVAVLGAIIGFEVSGIGGLIVGGFLGIIGGYIASLFLAGIIGKLIEDFRQRIKR